MTGSVASNARRLAWLAGALAPALLVFAGTPAMAQTGLTDETAPAIAQVSPPNKITSFDIAIVDPVLGRMFLADRTGGGITVVDTTTTNASGAPAPSYDTTLCFGKFAGAAPPAAVAGPNG